MPCSSFIWMAAQLVVPEAWGAGAAMAEAKRQRRVKVFILAYVRSANGRFKIRYMCTLMYVVN